MSQLRYGAVPQRHALVGVLFVALMFLAPAVWSHSYVPISDDALVGRAGLVVRGMVVASVPVVDGQTPYTDYVIRVDRVLKGVYQESALVVRTLGGTLPDGLTLHVPASPQLVPNDDVILFLSPATTGFRVVEFRLGAFHVVTVAGQEVAIRRAAPGSVQVAQGAPDSVDWNQPRSAPLFERWIQQDGTNPAAGLERDYFLPDVPLPGRQEPFKLFTLGGRPVRWRSTSPRFRTRGQLLGDPGGGLSSSQDGARAWNNASILRISVSPGGGGTQGFRRSDDVNSVIFEDPSDEISGSFNCAEGGTLAFGGWWGVRSPFSVGGRSFFEILEGDIVVQNDIDCFLRRDSEGAEELLAHESGHTIGIAHSGVAEALMFPFIHGDGRGARLHADDRAALRALRYDAADPDNREMLERPRGVEPRGTISDRRPRFVWTNVRDAEFYELRIEESRSGRQVFFGTFIAQLKCGGPCEIPKLRRAALRDDVRYKWKVRALARTRKSPDSVGRIFRIKP